MSLWKLLIAISLISWYLPVITFRANKKYLPFLVVNSLFEPIYIALSYILNFGMYNYIPLALLCESMTFPGIDSKVRTVSAVALFLLAITVGRDSYLELVICESVLSLMIFYLLKDAILEAKRETTFKVFQLLLLIYFLRNSLLCYLYYIHQTVLIKHYSEFLITVIILPILIAYFGPEKKISISKKIAVMLQFIPEVISDISALEITNKKNGHGLAQREYEIIRLVSRGFTNRQIGEKLFLSKSSIDHSRVIINEKLGICKQSQYIEFLEKYPPPQKII